MKLPVALLLVAFASGCSRPDSETPGTRVFHNGLIYTVDPARPMAEAMAVSEGRIVAIGPEDSVLAAFPDAERVDLGAAAVIPGLIDAHAHLRNLAAMHLSADLVGTTSIAGIITRLQAHAATLPGGAWILGRGWDQNDWQDPEFPSRADLDTVFPDTPVWLERIDGHAMWANSAAIRAAGEDAVRTAADPPGGRILRDAAGEPTGIFIDDAEHLVSAHVPPVPIEVADRGFESALAEASRYGITGVHEAGSSLEDIDRFKRFADDGRLPLRIYAMVEPGPSFDAHCNAHLIDYKDLVTVRSVKLYLDGALGSRGAALLQDYSDDPGNRGLLRTSPGDFDRLIRQALECGYQVNTHAIGDSANRLLVDAYEAAGIRPEGRHRNEHTQIVEPGDFARMASLGIIASVQPTHATSDMYWAEDRLGKGRIQGAYAWRTLLDSGVRLALGSDFPVERVDPLLGFHAAVTRQDGSHWPEGGWYPDQVLGRDEALRGFTLDAAWAAFQERSLGSLSPGKWADFVVLSADLMSVPSPDLLETRVVSTWLAGMAVYQAEESRIDALSPDR